MGLMPIAMLAWRLRKIDWQPLTPAAHCGMRCVVFGILLAVRLTAEDPFAAGVRTTKPLSPAAEAKTFSVPDGFRVELFAAEPQINKPMNMAFDARGRLWVTSTVEYPFPAKPGTKGRDSVKVLELSLIHI